MTASVTFTGLEVAHVVGALAGSVSRAWGRDYEVQDLMLDRAIGAMADPMTPDVALRIAELRTPPAGRFWVSLCDAVHCNVPFTPAEAAARVGCPLDVAEQLLAELEPTTDDLERVPTAGEEAVYVLPMTATSN